MSYCRWSSDNWRCDVYVYESCSGGWLTHVAGQKRVLPPIPDLPWRIGVAVHRWSGGTWNNETRRMDYPSAVKRVLSGAWFKLSAFWHNRVHMGSLHLIPLRPIGLPHDGESFSDDTPEECADRLEALRAIGYNVPQHAIDELREEAASAA